MKKLLIDTNIVIDLLAKREPFYLDAAKLFSFADKNKVMLCVSSLTFANTNYILLKNKGSEEAKLILRKLKLLVVVLNLDEKVVDLSLNDFDFKDFEDALQYYSAVENDVEIIITRNLKDFQKGNIPVMNATQFMNIAGK